MRFNVMEKLTIIWLWHLCGVREIACGLGRSIRIWFSATIMKIWSMTKLDYHHESKQIDLTNAYSVE